MAMEPFYYTLPAVCGTQAGHEFFTAMCPLALIPRLFPLENPRFRTELQLQRMVNKARIPEIVRYITAHPKGYILSSLTASVDTRVEFEKLPGTEQAIGPGYLKIPMTAQLLLHDGLHRRAAIEAALKLKPDLAEETIALVLYVDPGLRRAEQMFTDLKRNETHSARSRSILCDHRDELAKLVRTLVARVPVFDDMTEMIQSKISNRSRKLFTLSALYHATRELLADRGEEAFSERLALAVDFWTEVAKYIPDWGRAKAGEVTPGELRKTCVHAHAIALAALGRAGRALLGKYPSGWRSRLKSLQGVDWSRSNTHQWEGRAMFGGRLSKASVCVLLTGNLLKRGLGLPLTDEEEAAELQFRRTR
jgi:DNA sulfur modification protein DndB